VSIYRQAVSTGVSALGLLMTGTNAATSAAYNSAYEAAAIRSSLADAKNTAQMNIAAINQDKVTSNTQIRMQQNRAEAMVIINAAAAGVEGGSVEDVIYETEKNEAFAINKTARHADQAKENQLAMIGSQTSQLLSVDDQEHSLWGDLLGVLSSFEMKDLKTNEALQKGEYSLPELWSK